MRRPRLTLVERRRIAAGAAKGLGAAAIARQLDRPTSTISRELARSGGAPDYRAGAAHRAAADRARRGVDRRRSARRSTVDAAARIIETSVGGAGLGQTRDRAGDDARTASRSAVMVSELTADFTRAGQESGLPRSAARVMTALYLSPTGERSARDLATELGLSPATVSAAVGHLDLQGLITRRRVGRREHYAVGADVWVRTLQATMRADRRWAAVCRRGADLLGPDTPQGARLVATWRFMARLETDLRRTIRAAGYSTGR